MRLARLTRLVLLPLLVAGLLLSGCGPTSEAAASRASGGAASVVATDANCPTSTTEAFPKARFVLNVGLAAGVFHRWLWKPYQAGTFASGSAGRTTALVKAGVASAFVAKQVSDAVDNVKHDPTLCGILLAPLTELSDALGGLKGKVSAGNFSSLTTIEGLLTTVMGKSQEHGLPITEQTDESLVG